MTTLLRPWDLSDTEDLRRAFADSHDLGRQVGGADLSTVEKCQEFISRELGVNTPSTCNFAINVDGAAVGNVGLGRIEHGHDSSWVHYWVSATARGQGLASRAVATRAGFAAEGIERQKLRYGTVRFDVERHGRLRSDPEPTVDFVRIVHVERNLV